MNDEYLGAERRCAQRKSDVVGSDGAMLAGLGLCDGGPCWRRHDMECEKWDLNRKS